ncbi:DUF6338 family protein [Treponema zuelzerae]|uniref:DUF6338 family protein n=1 Tax=Teretinema zuelzerae TaxID=156 RepID=A0AAE3EFB5_9SPIR|nr:DUF6338 family protein [Teretinema zuelzerae]
MYTNIINALIYTVIINAVVYLVSIVCSLIGNIFTIGVWDDTVSLIWSVIISIILAIIISFILNSDCIHKFLRDKNLTKQTPYPSEWYGVFSENITFIVLHLNDERRIMGWPDEWPTNPLEGHFALSHAMWLIETDGNEDKNIDLDMDSYILIKATDVRFVEFMKE